jgi:hypothetical protein
MLIGLAYKEAMASLLLASIQTVVIVAAVTWFAFNRKKAPRD